MKQIAIVGGGISGLAAANALEKRAAEQNIPIKITIIERANRIGGNISTEDYNGFKIEGGPDSFFSPKPAAIKLAIELGLTDSLLNTNSEKKGISVYHKKRLHNIPDGVILLNRSMIKPLLFGSLMSIRGKLRMALEPFIPKKNDGEDESLANFIRRRVGGEFLYKITEPLLAGIHAGNAETMSIRSTFPQFVQLEEEYGSITRAIFSPKRSDAGGKRSSSYTPFVTLKDGMKQLPEAIVSKLKDTEINLNIEVEKISETGSGYKISAKGGKEVEADVVIITTPAYSAADMLEETDAELDAKLREINYASTATITLAYPKEKIDQSFMKGFGIIIPRSGDNLIKAITITSNKFFHRAPDGALLIRVFVGGGGDDKILSLSDSDIMQKVREELKSIMGIAEEPLLNRINRWNNVWPQYEVGHKKRVDRIEEIVSKHKGLYLTGAAYRGIGIADSVLNSDKIAEQILSLK
ncbi:MAG: protoporphyrinogen oxidase [Nitrospinae bacterium]|nr:protoporphyrinogen oxidase [Nitrospinota bacterium]